MKKTFNRFYGLIFISLILSEYVDIPYARTVQYLLGLVFIGLLILELVYTKRKEDRIEVGPIVILVIFSILALIFGLK